MLNVEVIHEPVKANSLTGVLPSLSSANLIFLGITWGGTNKTIGKVYSLRDAGGANVGPTFASNAFLQCSSLKK
jgi:hypothetical protein